jgi:hypothetical protein
MKKVFYIISISILTAFIGCEDVSVVNPDLSYKEYIVVRAELVANEDFTGVKFTRTQPLNQQYDSTTAAITANVTAYLKINGVQVIPLHHAGNGIYLAIDRIRIQPGYTYELFAEIGDTGIYSKTSIPQIPVVVSTQFVNGSHFQASVSTKTNEVYGAAWEIYEYAANNILDGATDFKEIVQNTNEFNKTPIPVNTLDLPDKYRSNNYSNLWYIRVYAFDPAYFSYFLSRNDNKPVSDVFSQGGGPINWNVVGNNVIGMFIGVAKSDFVKVQ